jgi:hypothetical protein
VNGRLFTASNGQSLFLPAAGFRWCDEIRYVGSDCGYLSSSLNTDYPFSAWGFGFGFGSDYYVVDYIDRDSGLSVRPVRSASQK